MFASIPNYKEFYDESDVNKQGNIVEFIEFVSNDFILTQFRGAKDKSSKLKTPALEAVVFGPNGEI